MALFRRRAPAVVDPRWRAMKQPPFLRGSQHAPQAADGAVLFLAQFAAYVLLLGLAYTAQSGLLKALANVYAVVIFGLVGFAWLTRRYPPSSWSVAVFVCFSTYIVGIICSLIVNPQDVLWGDLVKLAIAPAFLFFGAAFERVRGDGFLWQRPAVRLMFATLVVVPLLTWGAQLLQSGFEIDGVRETSIFANRNNAAVYAVTMVGLFTVVHGRPLRSLFLFMVVGVMFGTLGVLLAVLIALTLTVAKARELALLALLVAAGTAGYLTFPELDPFKRITPVVDSVRLLYEGRINLRTVTFGELVLLLKTQDLSFLFRLKHWTDLWQVFAAGDAYQWLFGHGVGSSVRLSDLKLVPHNDYVRVGFELGVVTLAAWLAMLLLVLVRCGRRWETVPILVVLIYLFSENLITNYVAMAFFYFSGGALAERIGAKRATPAAAQAPRATAAQPTR
jgi:hypothetical protein